MHELEIQSAYSILDPMTTETRNWLSTPVIPNVGHMPIVGGDQLNGLLRFILVNCSKILNMEKFKYFSGGSEFLEMPKCNMALNRLGTTNLHYLNLDIFSHWYWALLFINTLKCVCVCVCVCDFFFLLFLFQFWSVQRDTVSDRCSCL